MNIPFSNILVIYSLHSGARVIQTHLKGITEMGQNDTEFVILKYALTNNCQMLLFYKVDTPVMSSTLDPLYYPAKPDGNILLNVSLHHSLLLIQFSSVQ